MRFLALIGLLAIAVAVGAAVYFFGGFYNVAGTNEDPAVVHWALERVRVASIERNARDRAPANLNDAATVQAGARDYLALGCATCHGAPGVKWAKFSEGLHPDPPDLKDAARDLTPEAVFWVAKHGINMTGMPSFAGAGASDEQLWRVAAFVKKLPSVSDADFKTWTAAQQAVPQQAPPQQAAPPQAAPQQ
jgi:mono/diheme cytochrome c family protein